MRHRADKLVEEYKRENNITMSVESMTNEMLSSYIKKNPLSTLVAKRFQDIRKFNMMFKTHQGDGGQHTEVYLRPETAQGIFVNFKNIRGRPAADPLRRLPDRRNSANE